MSDKITTSGNPESRGNKKIYAARYKTTHLPKEPYTLPQTQKSSKIAAIDSYILTKYKHSSGHDLEKHEDEFLKGVEESNVGPLSEKDAEELEDKNFHTALDILRRHKLAPGDPYYKSKKQYDD